MRRPRPTSAPAGRHRGTGKQPNATRGRTADVEAQPPHPTHGHNHAPGGRPASAAPARGRIASPVAAHAGTQVMARAVRSRSVNPLAAAALGRAQAQSIRSMVPEDDGSGSGSGDGDGDSGSGGGGVSLMGHGSGHAFVVRTGNDSSAGTQDNTSPTGVTSLNLSSLRGDSQGSHPQQQEPEQPPQTLFQLQQQQLADRQRRLAEQTAKEKAEAGEMGDDDLRSNGGSSYVEMDLVRGHVVAYYRRTRRR